MAWIDDLQRIKITLVFCPRDHVPLDYLEHGVGIYRCRKCGRLIRAAISFLDDEVIGGTSREETETAPSGQRP